MMGQFELFHDNVSKFHRPRTKQSKSCHVPLEVVLSQAVVLLFSSKQKLSSNRYLTIQQTSTYLIASTMLCLVYILGIGINARVHTAAPIQTLVRTVHRPQHVVVYTNQNTALTDTLTCLPGTCI